MDKASLELLTKNALTAQAVGDAFGVPVEGMPRSAVRALRLRDMTGCDMPEHPDSYWGGRIPAGVWSDDTSMTLASMDSFVCRNGEFHVFDQLSRFCYWWYNGKYCCIENKPFGLGGSVGTALRRFRTGVEPARCGGSSFDSNGNGSLMRILPFAIYCMYHELDEAQAAAFVGDGSALTHAHEVSRMCCFVWTEFLRALAADKDPEKAIDHIETIDYSLYYHPNTVQTLNYISEKRIRSLAEADIGEGGFVSDTLKAALFSILNSDSLEDAIITAVELGGDTDTAAAVTGTAAGILYGIDAMPERWINRLQGCEMLEKAAEEFVKAL